jgi:hypothetical protein
MILLFMNSTINQRVISVLMVFLKYNKQTFNNHGVDKVSY